MMRKLDQKLQISYQFSVFFGRDVFDPRQPLLADLLSRTGPKAHRVLYVIDSGVVASHPGLTGKIEGYRTAHSRTMELCDPPLIVPGGEGCKSDFTAVDAIHERIRSHRLCRQSFVAAIGGGAVLDVAGYAAATAHRGLRLIRMPTTVLAQNDAGIGVKNGLNGMGRKNFIGTFAPPFAVINDSIFLSSLPPRHLRAGMAEAVKVALIKDKSFFNYLYTNRHQLAAFEPEEVEESIHRCAALHMDHIGTAGDPFEFGSARPLDFGHWSAHRLEEMTAGSVLHGEAVAIGIALDTLYSMHKGMLSEYERGQIFRLLTDLGLPLYHPGLAEMDLTQALNRFQEHLGGDLAVTMLNGIGRKVEVARIDLPLLESCVRQLALLDPDYANLPISDRLTGMRQFQEELG